MISTARQDDQRSHVRYEGGMGRAFAQLCGLSYGPSGWWHETWFLLPLGGAIPFWIMLWWHGAGHSTQWTWQTALLYLSLSVWRPFCEELGFRGLLQGMLLDHAPYRFQIGPLSLANLLTTVAFGIAHLPGHPLPWVAGIFAVSLLLGYARDRTASILPAIVWHSYFNAGYFFVLGLPLSS